MIFTVVAIGIENSKLDCKWISPGPNHLQSTMMMCQKLSTSVTTVVLLKSDSQTAIVFEPHGRSITNALALGVTLQSRFGSSALLDIIR